jgi:hypothetical protein
MTDPEAVVALHGVTDDFGENRHPDSSARGWSSAQSRALDRKKLLDDRHGHCSDKSRPTEAARYRVVQVNS